MNGVIIYKSYHNMNTEKVAKAMAEAIDVELVKVEDLKPKELAEYELIGFGSGIYGGNFHKDLMAFIEDMPPAKGKVFIFSTSGGPVENHHDAIKEKLTGKGFEIVGEFNCPGEFRPLKIGFLSKNKGRPNTNDLNNARKFAEDLLG